MAFRRKGSWRIASTTSPSNDNGEAINLARVQVSVEPRREWAEMFENAWRLDRDVFFSRVMNGNNWQAVHDAYARLLPSLGSQDDFIYLPGHISLAPRLFGTGSQRFY